MRLNSKGPGLRARWPGLCSVTLLFFEHLLCDGHLKCIVLSNLHKTLQGRYLLISLAEEETEDQRHEIISPRFTQLNL